MMKKSLFLFFVLLSFLGFSQEENSSGKEITEVVELNEDSTEVPFAVIEEVPIYKGCDENMGSQALKECMSSQISSLITSNFDVSVVDKYNLPNKKILLVNVSFKIDKDGSIIDIKGMSEYPELELEAVRVINLIPKFTKPGYQMGKPVIVPFYIPIKMAVSNSKKKKRKNRKSR